MTPPTWSSYVVEEKDAHGEALVSPAWRARNVMQCWRVLHQIQEQQWNAPDVVLRVCTAMLERFPSALGDQEWDIRERALVAALEVHDRPVAERLLRELTQRFGDESVRVSFLTALCDEERGAYEQATQRYHTIVANNLSHVAARKRLIALSKSRGEWAHTIQQLTEYTRIFAADEEAWLELSNLYAQQGMYEQAAFCIEELILLSPHHYLFHLRFAELMFNAARFATARDYFSQSLELKPKNNVRALYGLLSSTRALLSTDSSSSSSSSSQQQLLEQRELNTRLLEWATQQLAHEYEARAAPATSSLLTLALEGGGNDEDDVGAD